MEEVDYDLRFCVDERSPCGLSVTEDIKMSRNQKVTT